MARKAAQPGFHAVEAFADGGEAQTVNDPLDRPYLFIDAVPVGVRQANAGREIAKRYMIAAECLEGSIRVYHLVVGVRVQELDWLIMHHLPQELRDGFAFVEP